MSAHRAPASRRRTTMHMPSLPLESSLAEFAHPPRSAPALLDYLAATNSDTSAVQANRETRQTSLGEGNASTTVLSSSPRTSSSYAAVCVSAKSPPLPLPPVPQKRVMALSKAVRFNRVGHVVQAAAAAKEEDEEEDDESARASLCGEAGSLAVYGDQTSVTSVTAAAATANSALVEPNLGSRRASLSACMQDTTQHEALCSDTSNHTCRSATRPSSRASRKSCATSPPLGRRPVVGRQRPRFHRDQERPVACLAATAELCCEVKIVLCRRYVHPTRRRQ